MRRHWSALCLMPHATSRCGTGSGRKPGRPHRREPVSQIGPRGPPASVAPHATPDAPPPPHPPPPPEPPPQQPRDSHGRSERPRMLPPHRLPQRQRPTPVRHRHLRACRTNRYRRCVTNRATSSDSSSSTHPCRCPPARARRRERLGHLDRPRHLPAAAAFAAELRVHEVQRQRNRLQGAPDENTASGTSPSASTRPAPGASTARVRSAVATPHLRPAPQARQQGSGYP